MNFEIFPSQNLVYSSDEGLVYQGDCNVILKGFPKNSVDCIIIDPPYGVAQGWRAKFQMLGDYGNSLVYVIPEMFRILKPTGSLYLFSSCKKLAEWLPLLNSYFRYDGMVVWYKKLSHSGKYWRYNFEIVLIFDKGKPAKYKKKNAVIEIPREEKRFVLNQKPVQLIKEILEVATKEDDIVLDCFAGSGTTGIACKEMKRKFILCEINPENVSVILNRLNGMG